MSTDVPVPEGLHARALTRTLLLIALVVAVVGSLGAPLITSVATTLRVSLDAAQRTLTIALLAGRAAQGCGLALTPLMMAAAREHLGSQRSASAIAMISVASTVGIGAQTITVTCSRA